MDTKKCSKCGIEKPLDEFGIIKERKSGHRSECKECNRKYKVEYRKKLREKAMIITHFCSK